LNVSESVRHSYYYQFSDIPVFTGHPRQWLDFESKIERVPAGHLGAHE
jgi:hypothetical protein